MKTDELMDRKEAAAWLGVSLATFDRIRQRCGLQAEGGPLLKPIKFSRRELGRVTTRFAARKEGK